MDHNLAIVIIALGFLAFCAFGAWLIVKYVLKGDSE